MQREFSRAELLERASLRVAMHIRGVWEERGSSDTRLLEGLFLPDDLTVVGRSRGLAADDIGRREHVVPRLRVIRECIALIKADRPDAEIADFIARHVKIVQVTREECARLDRARGKGGSKQDTPADWMVGDNIYLRLHREGILWEPFPSTPGRTAAAVVSS